MKITVNRKKFIETFKNAATFCASGESVLSCVNMQINDGKLELAATDGNSLYYYPMEFETEDEIKNIDVNIQKTLVASLKNTKSLLPIIIEFGDEEVKFLSALNNGDVIIKTYDGTFPKYKQLLMSVEDYKKREHSFAVSPALLSRCLNAVNNGRLPAIIYTDGFKGIYVTNSTFENKGGKILLMPVEVH